MSAVAIVPLRTWVSAASRSPASPVACASPVAAARACNWRFGTSKETQFTLTLCCAVTRSTPIRRESCTCTPARCAVGQIANTQRALSHEAEVLRHKTRRNDALDRQTADRGNGRGGGGGGDDNDGKIALPPTIAARASFAAGASFAWPGIAGARPMHVSTSTPSAQAVISGPHAAYVVRFDGPVNHRTSRLATVF